jgi:tetratricopeptide (TPR) repeat protein
MNLRLLCLFAPLALAAPRSGAADAGMLVPAGLAAEAALNTSQALELFLAADAARPNDAFILQKISRQYSDSTVDTPDVSAKQRLVATALTYAMRSSALEPDNAVYVLSLAICHGKLGLYGDTRTKVENARLIKKYAERSLELDPAYDWACHVLGRWHYEVAELGVTKRLLVRLIFGGLPEASPATAVTLLQRAVALAPENPAHHIELGFAYAVNRQPDLARQSWAAGLALPSREKHDEEAKRRARQALARK